MKALTLKHGDDAARKWLQENGYRLKAEII